MFVNAVRFLFQGCGPQQPFVERENAHVVLRQRPSGPRPSTSFVHSIRNGDLERGLSVLRDVLNSHTAVRIFFTELRFVTYESLAEGQ